MKAYFGGPDLPARALRDLLQARVEGVPAGGTIDWMTYYFRDEALADALVAAKRRGVRVLVRLEGKPRHRGANDAVIARLRAGIGEGLKVETRLFGASHLHTKLYAFGGDRPHVLVGSFNPSGNDPEDVAIIADIGDQDRGHNLLVEIDEPAQVQALLTHVRDGTHLDGPNAFSFPRGIASPLDRRIAALGRGAHLRIAASHLRDAGVARQLKRLAAKGARVEVLTHHTRRRTPDRLIAQLRRGSVHSLRYHHPEELPMHAKFILAEDGARRWSAFGSYNLTRTSRWLNQEVLIFSDDAALWGQLDARWASILAEPWVAP
ncbi:phosphatidylserine/phosphatidylglycerophosphate/cardiolipin synthase family protein [Sphingomonas lutea]|uniref:phospholipase D n=1 Tax=Sphingomonas lutea TaxID=1045317 RepID=A0A7G9SF68_9SPHN|nr:phospholipase D-like domain-containing protein [Sphingomonas lutea]QNN66493.1 phosphatidylserine/phosphatidylglycerophosphate/cardiolipin synthase family protein [Sphingomonas lutea]